ncbi:MAG: TraR/DksA C4-type zinc finger protein [Victivallales bacterium]|jgi:DnaK suppressor protein
MAVKSKSKKKAVAKAKPVKKAPLASKGKTGVKKTAPAAKKTGRKVVPAPRKTAPAPSAPKANKFGKKNLKKIPPERNLVHYAPAPKLPAFKGAKKKYYDMLLEIRRQMQGQINFHSGEALSTGASGDLSNSMSNHMADFGSDNFLHEMELEMMTSEIEVIEMIDEAIERLASGEFGKCLDCGCQISTGRLDAKPYARFCIKCKSLREENNGLRPEFNR